MSDERRGIVHLSYAGRAVPIRFTWAAIDRLGRAGVGELIEKAASGLPGDMAALAALIEAGSAGELTAATLLADDALPFTEGYVAVLKAWTAAARRPTGVERDANPLNRLWTSLKTLWRRLWRQG
jgi:hypothetical protein